jgi:hypothetical protein
MESDLWIDNQFCLFLSNKSRCLSETAQVHQAIIQCIEVKNGIMRDFPTSPECLFNSCVEMMKSRLGPFQSILRQDCFNQVLY